MTINKELTAGDDIDSRCLKCKQVTNHTIAAMVGSKVAKVQCNVCRAVHNYRPVQVEKKTTLRRSGEKSGQPVKTPRISKELKAENNFLELLGGRDPIAAVRYAMTKSFAEDDLVNHPFFGIGLVTRVIPPNKIDVVFKEGSKILICAPKVKK
ncbi:MAG: hypothetical protein L6365_20835 [Desulfobulbaceae bacterium]|nr:hypothetical protein [Desulfobulbaceae bacterium]